MKVKIAALSLACQQKYQDFNTMKARGTHSLPRQESLVGELHRTPTVVEELGIHGLPPVPAFNQTWRTFDFDLPCWVWVGEPQPLEGPEGPLPAG